MQGNVNIPDSTITSALTFRNLVLMNMQQLTNFPYIEKDFDALTDYELLCLVVKFLNDVIANQNEQNDSITNMYNAFLALQTYVNNTKDELEDAFNNLDDYVRNYFDNLDVQEEINNKLDQMLEDGVLEQIIEQFIQSSAVWSFDTVADMKLATNFANGSFAKTLGFHSLNDDGGAFYKIRTKTNDDVIDEKFIIAVYDNNLVAELITNNLNIKQLGAYGDNTHDDTSSFSAFSNSNNKSIIIPYGEYIINDILTFENKEIIGVGKPILKLSNQSTSREHYIVLNGYAKMENIYIYNNIRATKTIGLINCNDVVIRDCYLKLGDNLKSGGLLDLYTNNKNVLIENCEFDFKSYSDNSNGAGGIWVREYDSSKTSENIKFNNCYISHYSSDECIAVWMWNGVVKNVQLNNCKFEGKENNPCPHFITFSALNSSMNSCLIINKPGVQKSSIIHRGDVSSQEVTINNCEFDLDETFINGIVNSNKAILKNCIINNEKLTHIEANLFKNCIINTPGFKMDNSHLEDCTINITDNYSFESSGAIEYGTQLINCIFNNLKIPVNNFIKNNAGTNKLYKIINCQFNGDYTGNTYFMLASNETELYIVNSILPNANCFLSNENNTGYIANNLIGSSIGTTTGIKQNNNFNYNS